jgi:hypothetical protein
MSRTVTLKIAASGALLLAHPGAKSGPEHLVYAINNVPADVPPAQVARQVSRVCLAHPHSDVAAWSYEWAELAHLPRGAIINRCYPRAA